MCYFHYALYTIINAMGCKKATFVSLYQCSTVPMRWIGFRWLRGALCCRNIYGAHTLAIIVCVMCMWFCYACDLTLVLSISLNPIAMHMGKKNNKLYMRLFPCRRSNSLFNAQAHIELSCRALLRCCMWRCECCDMKNDKEEEDKWNKNKKQIISNDFNIVCKESINFCMRRSSSLNIRWISCDNHTEYGQYFEHFDRRICIENMTTFQTKENAIAHNIQPFQLALGFFPLRVDSSAAFNAQWIFVPLWLLFPYRYLCFARGALFSIGIVCVKIENKQLFVSKQTQSRCLWLWAVCERKPAKSKSNICKALHWPQHKKKHNGKT